MRRISILLLLAISVMLGVGARAEEDNSEIVADFKVANAAYKRAIEKDDNPGALIAATEALELGVRIYQDDDPSLANLYLNQGVAFMNAGDFRSATWPLWRGIERREKIYGDMSDTLIEPYMWLSHSYASYGESDDSAHALERIYVLTRDAKGKNSEEFAKLNLELGIQNHLSAGTLKNTRRYLKIALRNYTEFHGEDSLEVGVATYWLGRANMDEGYEKRALKYLTRALSIVEKHLPPGDQIQLSLHAHLVQVYEEMGESDEATKHCQAISLQRPSKEVDGYLPLYKKRPIYPRSAAIKQEEGWVLVEFTVTDSGMVSNPVVLESGGWPTFKKSALRAVKDFRYAPAIVDGEFVETTGVRNLLTFKMSY